MTEYKKLPWGTKTFIMGIINATPDSFSGDGTAFDIEASIRKVNEFVEYGVDILDIGGESSRPKGIYDSVTPVDVDQELTRVIPVIEAIRSMSDIPISIDTWKSEVAKEAIASGASIVNDIWGLKKDTNMASVVAQNRVGLILTHNGTSINYNDVVDETILEIENMIVLALDEGIDKDCIIIDPGFGFGKNPEQNLQILGKLEKYKKFDLPVLIGTSRKSTIGYVLDLPVEDRIEGTAATIAISITKKVDIVRVHDVKEMGRVVKMSDAIVRGWSGV
ncbi:MAG: dihydropteroate synthase [Dehalococcoidia bacterium]|nr:dihydropteroate synthase [Dehalococcoidia bacterium]